MGDTKLRERSYQRLAHSRTHAENQNQKIFEI